ncbi:MFS transporter [Commensalibacter nepenthis]|uniref:MFS transporter n=1 Tax=Commensalibacter nepenthis TaxID=3043872 RepID=A0ABT6Q975_9PROT|nr:MFS transporter [Commensalibacter sp. TBRC 10068]MDI2112788.1 MFS transporter [Commensalibacter sp. TBRC 10068]
MKKWSANQINTVFAALSSWGLDAFDFFLLVFVIDDIATSFSVTKKSVSIAIFLTLALRPVGAFFIGRLAEQYGRKPVLMGNVALFSILSALSAFAPNLIIFLLIRCVYGVAMGGVWGVASSLAFETIPKESKGFISGLFQAGYPLGYLTASVVYALFFDSLGWRYLFIIGAFPILLVIFIHFFVQESAVWLAAKNQEKAKRTRILPIAMNNWQVCLFAIILMTCFNLFSHGTQDSYPLFLKEQHHFTSHIVGGIAIAYNIASIMGGIFFGSLSQKIGRSKAIALAAGLSLFAIPLWAFSNDMILLGVGAFIMQFMVQGAWGVIPVYLNELLPASTRTVLPGFFYQMGNLFASANLIIQIYIAEYFNNNYGLSLAIVAGLAAICIMILMRYRMTHPQLVPHD